MRRASEPDGYDESYIVETGRSDWQVGVGFDRERGYIPRFLVNLYYATGFTPVEWTEIARFDHNETAVTGHDVYEEGLHIDVRHLNGEETTLRPSHVSLPRSRGTLIRRCVDYFEAYVDWFIDVYTGTKQPVDPPDWPPDSR